MILNPAEHILSRYPFLKGSRVLIAVSGGLDSMVLAAVCLELKLDFSLAHCNFKLRETESDHDVDFVNHWGDAHGIETFTQQFNTEAYAKEKGLSVQMAARELRYAWFHELADHLGFDYILTAHHADDSLETFFINLFRGSGIDGLAGIPERNGKILRPFLRFSRADIRAYADRNNLKWREDSSNASTKYLRNKIRQELRPVVEAIEPDILGVLARTQGHLRESSGLLVDYKETLQQRFFKKTDDGVLIEIDALKKLQPLKSYLYLLFSEFGFNQWDDLSGLIEAQSGKQIYSPTHRLLKDRDQLVLKPISKGRISPIPIPHGLSQLSTPSGYLELDYKVKMGTPDQLTLYADIEKLKFPLVLRNWEEGDFFYPSGMNGKKKLSKFFKDEKFSIFQKEKALVLCSGEDVVWIVGKRADRRFIADENSVNVLKIQLN